MLTIYETIYIMLNQLRFLYVVCVLALVVSAPYTIWSAANGKIVKMTIFAAIALISFVCLQIVRRNLKFIKQMNKTFDEKDIEPL